jgi:hypothetical protein
MIRSVAFKATRSISVAVQIPVAVDPLALGKVADAFAAALFVKDADQFLKGPAFHVTKPLVRVGDQLIDRAEIDGGNGSGQGGKPGAKEIVGQVITSAASKGRSGFTNFRLARSYFANYNALDADTRSSGCGSSPRLV